MYIQHYSNLNMPDFKNCAVRSFLEIYILSLSVGHNSELNLLPYLEDWAIRIDEVDILAPDRRGKNL